MDCSVIFFSFFILLFRRSSADSAADACTVKYCGLLGPPIRFPFRIRGFQSEDCGYPGFDLSCDGRGRAILRLPNSQEFIVDGIDYERKYVILKDPDYCFAKQLRNLTFSGSLFVVQDLKSLVFANCSHEFPHELGNTRVSCLSDEQHTVMFRYPDDSASATLYFREHGCTTWTVSVPIAWDGHSNSIVLTWDLPQCRQCEASGGQCGPKGWTDFHYGCSHKHKHGLSKFAKLGMICGISIFAIICLVGFRYYRRPRARVAVTSFAPVAGPRGQMPAHSIDEAYPSPLEAPRGVRHDDDDGLVTGLDLLTIESYPKVKVDDEGCLPRANDNVCTICLSEFRPRDVLRIIPQCAHYFHAHCIDPWLKRNASCPVCRSHQG